MNPVRQIVSGIWKNRAVSLGARVLVLVLALWWITRRLDLVQAANLLRVPDLLALMAMIAAALLYGAIGGLKIWILLQPLARVSLKRTVSYFFVASSIGSFTPAALGDFSLAAFLKHEQVPVPEGLAVVLVDRLVSVSLYVVVFTPFTVTFLVPNLILAWLPVLYLVGGAILLGLNSFARVRAWGRRDVIDRYLPIAHDFVETTSRLVRLYPRALFANVLVGILRCIVGGLVVWLALAVVGTYAPVAPVIAAVNTLSLINMLPISFAGLGVYEGGGVLLLEALGLQTTPVLAALVLQRIYVLVASGLIIAIASLIGILKRNSLDADGARVV